MAGTVDYNTLNLSLVSYGLLEYILLQNLGRGMRLTSNIIIENSTSTLMPSVLA